MAPTAASVWDWALAILPFTALITFVVTMVSCNLVPSYASGHGNLLQLSHISSSSSNIYFLIGFILLVPQVLSIIIGRHLFLLHSQGLVNGIILHVSHLLSFLPFILLLIMGLVNSNQYSSRSTFITYGILGSFALYCSVHTGIVFYLFIRKSLASVYSKVYIPIWLSICTLILIGFLVVWIENKRAIYGYIAATAPFLYFLGFVPQFWTRAKSRKPYGLVSTMQKAADRVKK